MSEDLVLNQENLDESQENFQVEFNESSEGFNGQILLNQEKLSQINKSSLSLKKENIFRISISNIKFKKFKSFLEAKTAANIYCREHVIPELQPICHADTLRPTTYSLAWKKEKERMISLGKLPQRIISQKAEISEQILTVKDFEYLYKHARLAGEEKHIEEKLFTEDKKNLSF